MGLTDGRLISLSAFFGSEKKSFLTDQKTNLFRQIRKQIFSDGHIGWGTLRKAFGEIVGEFFFPPRLPKGLNIAKMYNVAFHIFILPFFFRG